MAAVKHLAVCLLVLCVLSLIQSQRVKLTDNGYEGVLVAVSEDVPFDAGLISHIKSVFTEASATLYTATKYRAFFRNITILIPSSWPLNVSLATTETFDKANIRVDTPSSQYGNSPWVKQTAGCGVPGEFMHLTPGFLSHKSESAAREKPDEMIVREWGHLRWGLFDNSQNDPCGEQFYYSSTTNSLRPVVCPSQNHGRVWNYNTGAPCLIDPLTSLPEPACRFSNQNDTAKSKKWDHACGKSAYDPESRHDYEAPTQHNRLCPGQSVWDVISRSEDFANGANQAGEATHNTQPTYEVIKQRGSLNVVVVMDVSGSMRRDNNSIKMASAVKNYLLYTVQVGSSVGLVSYSSDASALTSGLIKVNTLKDRKELANHVQPKYGGSTAIGQGLLTAQWNYPGINFQLLEAGAADPAGSHIVLLTDGEENRQPLVADVRESLISRGIVVDTILLTEAASPSLISLAADTGGLSFYSSGADGSTSLSDAYTRIEESRHTNHRAAPVTILSHVTRLKGQSQSCFSVSIDDGLGRDSTFTFTWVTNPYLSIDITAPDGTSRPVDIESESSLETGFRCQGVCPTGIWGVCLKNNGDLTENVTSHVRSSAVSIDPADDSSLPITVMTRIVNDKPDFNRPGSQPVTLLATVAQGTSPVIGADVFALIESPVPGVEPLALRLRDSGAGADVIRDDGTYSAFVYNTQLPGKHTVSVQVKEVSGQTSIRRRHAASSQTGEPDLCAESLTPIQSLQRSSLAGFMDVRSVIPSGSEAEVIPPARVTDLEVVRASYNDSTVTLGWTAVGGDMDQGRAASYQLWTTHRHGDLIEDYLEFAAQVEADYVIKGSLGNVSFPYEREEITLRLEDRNRVAVYGLVVRDGSGNESPVSNLVSIRPADLSHGPLILAEDCSLYAVTPPPETTSRASTNTTTAATDGRVVTGAGDVVTVNSSVTATDNITAANDSIADMERDGEPPLTVESLTRATAEQREPTSQDLMEAVDDYLADALAKQLQRLGGANCSSDPLVSLPLTHSQLVLIVAATVPVVIVLIIMIFVVIAVSVHKRSLPSNQIGPRSDSQCSCGRDQGSGFGSPAQLYDKYNQAKEDFGPVADFLPSGHDSSSDNYRRDNRWPARAHSASQKRGSSSSGPVHICSSCARAV